MIIGIGTDIVQIKRIEKMMEKFPNEFVAKILTSSEISKYDDLNDKLKINFLAKRYAAKEAIAKAFGVGIGEELSFEDIEIGNDFNGKPNVIIYSKIGNNKKIDLSISDDYPIAVAFAVVSQ